jgi:DNA-binding NtrC family response regulator
MSDILKKSNRAHILIVEDSSVFREMQSLLLRQAGYAISAHEHPQAALAAAKERAYDLVVIDYELPGMNGQVFMHELRKILPDIAVVFVSGSLTLELAIQLSSEGVAGIFNKPTNPKVLLEKINETLNRSANHDGKPAITSNSPLPAVRRGNSNSPLAAATTVASADPDPDNLAYTPRYIVGQSNAFREFTHRLWKVRDFRSVLLLQGEAGSPFELLARDLAEISMFREGPVMLCDAEEFDPRRLLETLAPTLLSTDAGTLIVTGVELFSPEQQKVLGNLMSGRDVFLPFARRFRLILAAAANLSELADDGRFNDTLYYKISSLSLNVPSLRELREDILPNANQLLAEHRITLNARAPFTLTAAAATWLRAQDWPGNYAQLSRILLTAARHSSDAAIDVPALESGLRHSEKANTPAAVTSATTPVVAVAAAASEPAADRAPVANVHSVFRTATKAYDFSQRLMVSLATADAMAAS